MDAMSEDQEFDRRAFLRSAAYFGAAASLAAALDAEEAYAQTRGGTLNTIVLPEPPMLVLGLNNQGPTLLVASKIYEGLLRYSPKLEPLPALAKSWSVSPDGLTYTFNLQEGVKFHDGKPMTADDVIFSVTKFHPEVSPRLRPILARIASGAAPNPTTVVFTLKEPFAPLLLSLDVTCLAIVPKHLYDGTDFRQNPANNTPIGTGPFMLKEWQRGNFIHLAKFDGYWKPGRPLLENIYYRILPDSAARSLALQSGQVQMTQANDLEPFEVPRFQQQANLAYRADGWELFSPLSWLDINHRVKPLDDKRFRRALLMALDRKFIVDRIWFGVGKPATSPIASGTVFHDPSVALPAFDLRAANALLDQAGYPRNAQGVRVQLKLMPLPYGEVWTRLAEYARQQFQQIGVQVTLEAVDAATWNRRMGAWEYELSFNFVYQWGDPTIGVQRTYDSRNIQKINFTNIMGYQNPVVDALFDKAGRATDAAERRAAFSEIQKLLVEDVPIGWLIELSFPTFHDRRLTNVVTLGTGVHAPYDDVSFG
jgi:peptide/nickel transport system substrate-binding protein